MGWAHAGAAGGGRGVSDGLRWISSTAAAAQGLCPAENQPPGGGGHSLSGPLYRFGSNGGYREYCRGGRCHLSGWPWGHFLDVGLRIPGHGYQVRGGDPGPPICRDPGRGNLGRPHVYDHPGPFSQAALFGGILLRLWADRRLWGGKRYSNQCGGGGIQQPVVFLGLSGTHLEQSGPGGRAGGGNWGGTFRRG